MRGAPLARKVGVTPVSKDEARFRREAMVHGGFVAEIIHDPRQRPTVYHCIVQRRGDAHILAWHQSRSLSEARRAAQEYLRDLAGNQTGATAS